MLINEVDQSHVKYYDDQERMYATGYDFKALQFAIPCFPNLRGVRIIQSNVANSKRFKVPPPARGDAFRRMANVMGAATSRNSAREITAALAACKLAPKGLSWFDCDTFDLGVLGRIEDESGNICRLSRFNNFVGNPTKDLGFPLVCATFESLTSIKLKFSPTGARAYGPCQQHFGTALRGAQGLETLYITIDPLRISILNDQHQFSFTTILGSSTWPHLKHLSLTSFTIGSNDLPHFFARHPSLTHFTLDTAFALDFDWARLLQSSSLVPHWRRLRSLKLDGLWGARNWNMPSEEVLDRSCYMEPCRELDARDRLDIAVNLRGVFGKWARDVTGAQRLGELLERYFRGGEGKATPFPLRTGRVILAEVVKEKESGRWLPPDGGRNMIIATERVVGERNRYRDLYAEYLEDEYIDSEDERLKTVSISVDNEGDKVS